MKNPNRPPPEYISKLNILYETWSRKNEEYNKYVFADLDIIIIKYKEQAYKDEHFEAFTVLDKLEDYIKTGFAEKLSKELEYIKTIPIE